ncbi:MAG: acetyl-CoA acetyltransferase [Gammaproteobacteria bacterium]
MMRDIPTMVGIGLVQTEPFDPIITEPIALMEQAISQAIEDTGNPSIKESIDIVFVLRGFWGYKEPGKYLIEKLSLGSNPRSVLIKVGISQQQIIDMASEGIAQGKIRTALIVGGEARFSLVQALKHKNPYIESDLPGEPDEYLKPEEELYQPEETALMGLMAAPYYCIQETAFRAAQNLSPAEHINRINKIYENFSKVAQTNLHAWDKKPYTAEDLTEAEGNPMIAYPYTKKHNSNWNVNQASALLLTSDRLANKLTIAKDKRVYPLQSAENNHMMAVIQRPNLALSKGLELAGSATLDFMHQHKITDPIYEIYSCFPLAVQQFIKVLHLDPLSKLTITGAMPFGGGPLNNYMLHSTAQMIETLRRYPDKVGLVTGVSGMMTKQGICLWGTEPFVKFSIVDVTKEATKYDKPVPMSSVSEGFARVLGYTVIYENKSPTRAVFYCEDLKHNRKVLSSTDYQIIQACMEGEWVHKELNFKGNVLV